jgi:hypothetical protein
MSSVADVSIEMSDDENDDDSQTLARPSNYETGSDRPFISDSGSDRPFIIDSTQNNHLKNRGASSSGSSKAAIKEAHNRLANQPVPFSTSNLLSDNRRMFQNSLNSLDGGASTQSLPCPPTYPAPEDRRSHRRSVATPDEVLATARLEHKERKAARKLPFVERQKSSKARFTLRNHPRACCDCCDCCLDETQNG